MTVMAPVTWMMVVMATVMLVPAGESALVTDGCPHGCVCDGVAAVLRCGNASLTEVPEPTTALPGKYFDLHDNQIEKVSNDTFKRLGDLRSIDLSQNHILGLSDGAFSNLPHLEELNLHDNGLNSSQLDALGQLGESLHVLNLSRNQLNDIDAQVFTNLTGLVTLDLSGNTIGQIPQLLLQKLPELKSFNLSHNDLTCIPANMSDTFHGIEVLDLSHNKIQTIHPEALTWLVNLRELYLNHNSLSEIDPTWFENLQNLNMLSLSFNPTYYIPSKALQECSDLERLDVSHMPELTHLDQNSFEGLHNLAALDLSHNPKLENLHADTFASLHSLRHLDLSHNSFETIYHPTFQSLTALETLSLHGNPWSCDCEAIWLRALLVHAQNTSKPHIESAEKIKCASPLSLQGHSITDVPGYNFTCSGATVLNNATTAWFKIGGAAMLDCVVAGSPHPAITWISPRGVVLHYNPAYINWPKPGPAQHEFHDNHHWHSSDLYFHELPPHERLHILKNGSLYIDYVQRVDGGPFTCIAHNALGNDTVVIQFRLHALIQDTFVWSIIVGYCSAACFFVVGMICAAIRYAAHKCSRAQRQRRKSIRQVIANLDAYRTHQFGKLSAFKSAKIDQLSAFKTAKVDKLRSYKNITLATLVHYLERMREHYSTSVNRIKDNCTQQAEKLRENYTTQMGKFKDYRSHQIDKIRDNYNMQVYKIRDYGSLQLEKLREQYKQQQHYVLKIIELMDIGNCMTVIEAECMRTESMLFDPALHLDLDAHPVHVPPFPMTDTSDSEYETAGSHPNVTGTEIVQFGPHKPKRHKRKRHKSAERPTSLPTEPRRRKRKKHRHKSRHHKSTTREDASISGSKEDPTKHTADIVNNDTTGVPKHSATESDFQECRNDLREPSPGKESVYLTGQSEQSNTEYESAHQSRDHLPQIEETNRSFASLPSTPSTPTLTAEDTVIVIDPEFDSITLDFDSDPMTKESTV